MSSTGPPEPPDPADPPDSPSPIDPPDPVDAVAPVDPADSGEPADSEDRADQAYFRALEEAFLALRGRTTLLGPEDWQAARVWRRLGIPADLVISVMESLFARQRERRSRRGISSLRYFRAAVEAAWDERLEQLAGGARIVAELGPPVRRRLEAIAAALPGELDQVEAMRRAVLELEGEPAAVEERLEALERGWLEQLGGSLAEAEREALERRIRQALDRFAAAAPEAERASLAARLRAQALRERFRLPLISLFSPEALGEAEPPAAAS